MANINNKILSGIVKGRDREVLDDLNVLLLPKLKAYVLSNRGGKADVKDVYQEVLLTTYRKIKLEKFTPKGDLLNYMFVIGKNNWIAKSVKNQKNSDVDEFSDQLNTGEETSLNQLINQEKSKAAVDILNTIGQQCKDLLNLRIYEELDLPEIAKRLQMSNTDVVKASIYRCKKKLKEKIVKNKGFQNLLGIEL